MNGDILTLVNFRNLFDFALIKNTLLTISIKEFIMLFAFGNVFYDGDYVTGIKEKPDIRHKILADIYVFKHEFFDIIPYNTYFGIDKLINKMLNEKIPITKYEIKENWLDIGQIDDFKKAQKIHKENFITDSL